MTKEIVVRRFKSIPVIDILFCSCGGELKRERDAYMTDPMQYNYVCKDCDEKFITHKCNVSSTILGEEIKNE